MPPPLAPAPLLPPGAIAPTRRPTRVLPLFLLVFALALAAFTFEIAFGPASSDFTRYHLLGTTKGIPYLDYQVEYPPLTWLTFHLISLLAPSYRSFAIILAVLNLALFGLITRCLYTAFGRSAALYWFFTGGAMAGTVLARNDLLAVAPAVLALVAWQSRQSVRSGLALAAAAFFKLWPAALFFALLPRRRRHLWAYAFAAAGLGLFLFAAWFYAAGLSGPQQALTLRGNTSWQIESLPGSIARFFQSSPPHLVNGAWQIGHFPTWVNLGLLGLGGLVALLAGLRGRATGQIGAAWVAAVVAILLSATLLSPQFIVWLLPGAALLWGQNRGRTTPLLIALCALATPLIDLGYASLINGSWYALLFILLRNLLLLVAGGLALQTLFQSSVLPKVRSSELAF